ncbi:MAG: PAS domain S-box protein [Fidelibacterota bacterium]
MTAPQNLPSFDPAREDGNAVLEIIPDAALIIGIDGNILHCNQRFESLTGYRRSDLTDLPLADIPLFSCKDRPIVLKMFREVLKAEREETLRLDWHPREGLPSTGEVQLRPFRKNGAATAVFLFIRDLSIPPSALETLQKTTTDYRQIFENMRDGWVITDLKSVIREVNPAFAEMTGYTRTQLMGKKLTDITLSKWHKFVKYAVEEEALIHGRSGIYYKEISRKDGSVLPVESVIFLERDRHNRPRGMWNMIRDITDRKNAQEAVAVSDYLYRLTLSNISETVFVTDDAGDFTFICPSTEKIFGYPKDEIAALENVSNLFGRQIFDPVKLRSAGELVNIEQRIGDKFGRQHDLLVSVKAVVIGKGTTLYTCRDITDRKRIDRLWALHREILEEVARGLSPGKLFDRITMRIDELLPAAHSALFLMMPDNQHLHLVSGPHIPDKWKERMKILRIHKDHTSCTAAVQRAEAIFVSDISKSDLWKNSRTAARKAGIRASWSQPILASDQKHVQGVLSLYFGAVHQPDEYEGQLLKTLTELIALVLEHRQNQEKVQTERERLYQVLDILPGSVCLFGTDHKIAFANQHFRDQYGSDFSKPCFEIMHAKSQPCADCPTFQVFETGKSRIYEWTLNNGATCLVHDLPFTDIDGSPLVLEYSLDISDRINMEKSLRASEEQFRLIWEKSPLGLRLTDADGQIVRVNGAYCKMVKKSAGQLEGQPLSCVYEKSRQNHILESHRRRFNGRTVKRHFETELTLWDGSRIWQRVSNAYFQYGDPPRELLLGIFQDISERKKAENILQKSEERYRAFINATRDMVFIKDDAFRYVVVNRANQEFFGKPEEEILGKTDFDLMSPGAARRCRETDKQALQSDNIVNSIEKVNGRMYETRKFMVPIGDRKGVGGFIRDITERRIAEENLQFQAMLLDRIQDGIVATDLEGNITYANATELEILGKSLDQVVGTSVRSFGGDPRRGATQEEIIAETLKKGYWRGEVANYLPDGKPIVWDSRVQLIRDGENRPQGMVGISTNITERKEFISKLEKSEKSLRALAGHLQNIREGERVAIAREIHDEIAQIFTALKIDLSILESDLGIHVPDVLEKYATDFTGMKEMLDAGIGKIRSLIRRLRPEKLENMGLIEAIRSQLEEVRQSGGQKTTFHSDLNHIHLNNEQRLAFYRIFQEALTNISRHAEADHIAVSINRKKERVVMTIRDNGIGIDPVHMKKPESYGIIGMRERAIFLGGTLTIKGQPGAGTEVVLEIPEDHEE